jgi:K+-transporting ATPase KdpF subunit
MDYARRSLDSSHDRIFRSIDWLCALLRSHEVRTPMTLEAMIMLAVSILTTVYLVYALLRPEKF